MITTIVSTIVVLGVLIFIHELGHFLVAKWSGVTVLRFSLGFGPKLITFQKGETEYCLSAIPLGGYVKMLGEEVGEEVTQEQKARSFASQPVSKRMGIVLAGPMSNFLLAIAIFAMIFAFAGIPQPIPEIGSVAESSPAQKAGLKEGDQVLSINDRNVSTWEELSRYIEEHGENTLSVVVSRNDEVVRVNVTPQISETTNIFGETVSRPIMGVTASGKVEIKEISFVSAMHHSLVQTWNLSKLFLLTVGKMIEGVISPQNLGGPILIAQMAGQQAQEGLINLIYFTALISVNLAVLNLLPIPMLDGGHLVFFGIEAVRGKPLSMRTIELLHRIGLFLLLMLMVFVFYNDIMRLLTGGGLP